MNTKLSASITSENPYATQAMGGNFFVTLLALSLQINTNCGPSTLHALVK